MNPFDDPFGQAYNVVRSRTRAERAAQKAGPHADPRQEVAAMGLALASLNAENAALKARLDKLEGRVNGIRIVGKEFSGEGDRGIRFNPLPVDDATDSALTDITVWDEDEGGALTGPIDTLQVVGPRVTAETGDAFNIAKITVQGVEILNDDSLRAVAATSINFLSPLVVSGETLVPGSEPPEYDGVVTVSIDDEASLIFRCSVAGVSRDILVTRAELLPE